MCGICGIVDLHGRRPAETELTAMTRALKKRGDDAHGIKIFKTAGLGHQRLSIQDLSSQANQPFSSPDGRYWIVFNGEIYNFKHLRRRFQSETEFRTTSDTEVLLYGWIKYGPDFLHELNGMFAFAIWDDQTQKLFCARDRFGVKPFHYIFNGEKFLFASEIKSLLKSTCISKEIDSQALSDYLSLGYFPGEKTVFKCIRKLQPGCSLELDMTRGLRLESYWDIRIPFMRRRESISHDDIITGLENAVKLRLVSDVPVGFFLSGGIDSSAVLKSAMGFIECPSVFSLGFHEASFSELETAKRFASEMKAKMNDIIFSSPDAGFMKELSLSYDQPFADTSSVPTYQLCRFASEYTKVVLSGDGGDEMFGGYETCRADAIAALGKRSFPFWNEILASLRRAFSWLPADISKVSSDYKLRQFSQFAGLPADRAHYSWRQLFSEAEKRMLCNNEIKGDLADYETFSGFGCWYDHCSMLDWNSRHMIVDIKTWLADDILVKVDSASMSFGLEVRNPFLDKDLFNIAAAIPFKRKADYFRTKKILRQSLKSLLPHYIVSGKKQGFGSPVSHWLLNDLKPLFFSVIKDDSFKHFFPNARYLENLFELHASGKQDQGYRLWALLMFGLWARSYL